MTEWMREIKHINPLSHTPINPLTGRHDWFGVSLFN